MSSADGETEYQGLGGLSLGDQVEVFSSTADAWVTAEVIAFKEGNLLRVEYPVKDYWCAKTLHLDSEHLVIDKKELTSRLGVTLQGVAGDSFPVVTEVSEAGAAATPECQLQGVLMPGDKVLSMEANTKVVRLDTAVDTDHTAGATAAMLFEHRRDRAAAGRE